MEEKKSKKVNLSTFLLIFTIIIIIIMGIFIYKLNNDKTVEIQRSADLQSQVNKLDNTISDLQGKINTISETINSNTSNSSNTASTSNTSNTASTANENTSSSKKYQIIGKYYEKNASGDEPFYTFSTNNTVTFGSLWMCSGKYTINNDTVKINFTSAEDPDGNKANVNDYNVQESVELTIIDNNTLKDTSDGIIYSK